MIAPNIELGSHLVKIAETSDFVAINKPAGIHSAPLNETDTSTMLNAVTALHSECALALGRKPIEGALVHRLDQGTSGALLFARSGPSYHALRSLWEERLIHKDYLAWADGKISKAERISVSLAHSPKSKKRMLVAEALGPAGQRQLGKRWETLTDVLPLILHSKSKRTLVLVRIHTGVTHQIRAVLAALGAPVLEDPIYSAATKTLPSACRAPLKGDDLKSLQTVAALLPKKHLAKSEPQPALLPEDGFFLHALRLGVLTRGKKAAASLSSESLELLKAGVVAQPPIWFGLSGTTAKT